LTKVLQEVILLVAGFHQHARGAWRRRIRPMTAQTPAQTPPATAKPPTEQSGDLWQRLRALADRAQKGDATALPEIRQTLDGHPQIWKMAGDWSVHAREVWVKLASGGDAVLAESTRRRLDALQEELSRPFQDRLECLLVERLVISLLQLQFADAELRPLRPRRSSAGRAGRRSRKGRDSGSAECSRARPRATTSVDAVRYRGRRWRTAPPFAVCLFGGSERSRKRAHAARIPSFSLLGTSDAGAGRGPHACAFFRLVPSPGPRSCVLGRVALEVGRQRDTYHHLLGYISEVRIGTQSALYPR
jgi:hypothetical protein